MNPADGRRLAGPLPAKAQATAAARGPPQARANFWSWHACRRLTPATRQDRPV